MVGLNKYLPLYLDEIYFGDTMAIKLQYISQSLDDHIKTLKGPSRTPLLVDVMLQMFDAI